MSSYIYIYIYIYIHCLFIDTRLTKAWRAIDWLWVIWKSDLTDKMKRSFFEAAVVSILLYGCTTWTLTKRMGKRLDDNYTRMLRPNLNKSWRQHPTNHQLYIPYLPSRKLSKLDEPDMHDTAGEQGRANKGYTPMDTLMDDQLEPTYSSSVRIPDVALKTCQKRWTIERNGERGSGIAVLAARDDDDDDIYISKTVKK